jgi:hypothetical protein
MTIIKFVGIRLQSRAWNFLLITLISYASSLQKDGFRELLHLFLPLPHLHISPFDARKITPDIKVDITSLQYSTHPSSLLC